MLLSMTGFGSKTVTVPIKKGKSLVLTIELKSLNSRFFETTFRLQGSLSFLEPDILSLLKRTLIRGRVYVSMHVLSGEEILEEIIPSLSAAQGYINALQAIQKKSKLSGKITIADIAQLPNIFLSQKLSPPQMIKKKILDAVNQTADALMNARNQEGTNLRKDLQKRFVVCQRRIEEIGSLKTVLLRDLKKVIAKEVAKADKNNLEARAKIENLYITLNKIDISEEVTRFLSHLSSIKKLMQSKQLEKGKRLDFTLQELFREINTVAAKCSDYAISAKSIDIKVELEKAREQVQNVL